MATVAIVLNTTYKLNNGEYAIALRVSQGKKQKYFSISTLITDQSLPFKCTAEDWIAAKPEDNGLGKFRKSFTLYKECNETLRAKLNDARNILKRYDEKNLPFSFEYFEADLKQKEVRKEYLEPINVIEQPLQITVQTYYDQQIKLLDEQGRVGLSGLTYEVQRMLKKFRPDALLKDVNVRFLESLEYWSRNERKNKDTTISVKMRNIQRVINQAIEDKLLKPEDYPFGEKKYSVNKRLDSKTKKIAITLDKITKLKALSLVPGSWLYFAQQYFLFSYYSRGMNFVDISYLKWSDISDTHITYVRRKTRGQFEIPINEHNGAILNYFKANYKVPGGFVFPILDTTIHITLKQQYTRKKTALSAVNHALKKLAEQIDEPSLKLTTNVGRHTYATGLKRSGANTAYITEALGHATQEQTQTYLDEFERGVIETWENKMFDV
ncbi:Phage integrase SAM-like domain-containing protein [Mucilaginibacter gossypiicola]|uniref:Phage integrase SAM-like domain-containing protein n=1 Tax=Mucilaginibacter gossypiicola TaxID=551995 RepID=A0A1H8F0W4_9SPHI|nr:site-specific integrase [Mucilaginibacter gossypiicola]SEN25359.1 Phage integrase SAM-like domain-containing protein [Mucilaginibacter gossypiicola]